MNKKNSNSSKKQRSIAEFFPKKQQKSTFQKVSKLFTSENVSDLALKYVTILPNTPKCQRIIKSENIKNKKEFLAQKSTANDNGVNEVEWKCVTPTKIKRDFIDLQNGKYDSSRLSPVYSTSIKVRKKSQSNGRKLSNPTIITKSEKQSLNTIITKTEKQSLNNDTIEKSIKKPSIIEKSIKRPSTPLNNQRSLSDGRLNSDSPDPLLQSSENLPNSLDIRHSSTRKNKYHGVTITKDDLNSNLKDEAFSIMPLAKVTVQVPQLEMLPLTPKIPKTINLDFSDLLTDESDLELKPIPTDSSSDDEDEQVVEQIRKRRELIEKQYQDITIESKYKPIEVRELQKLLKSANSSKSDFKKFSSYCSIQNNSMTVDDQLIDEKNELLKEINTENSQVVLFLRKPMECTSFSQSVIDQYNITVHLGIHKESIQPQVLIHLFTLVVGGRPIDSVVDNFVNRLNIISIHVIWQCFKILGLDWCWNNLYSLKLSDILIQVPADNHENSNRVCNDSWTSNGLTLIRLYLQK
jgi:hypothetical protein